MIRLKILVLAIGFVCLLCLSSNANAQKSKLLKEATEFVVKHANVRNARLAKHLYRAAVNASSNQTVVLVNNGTNIIQTIRIEGSLYSINPEGYIVLTLPRERVTSYQLGYVHVQLNN